MGKHAAGRVLALPVFLCILSGLAGCSSLSGKCGIGIPLWIRGTWEGARGGEDFRFVFAEDEVAVWVEGEKPYHAVRDGTMIRLESDEEGRSFALFSWDTERVYGGIFTQVAPGLLRWRGSDGKKMRDVYLRRVGAK